MAMQYKTILTKALKPIKPKPAELKKTRTVISELKKKLEASAKELKIDCEIVVGGSIAKSTWLSGKHDTDIFIRLSDKYSDLSKFAGDILYNAFNKVSRVHGSRDYYKFEYKGYAIEIVPVLKIKSIEDIKNTTDASPFHVEFVSNEIHKKPQLKDEIILLKQFCRANGIYGAETWISGFSGYVIELLTIHYGSFLCVLEEAAANWTPQVVIDIKKYYLNEYEAVKAMDKSKTRGPLVIVDPLQKERNAAASINNEAFDKFIFFSKKFLAKPDISFFTVKEGSLSEVKKIIEKKSHKMLYFEFKMPSKVNIDIYLAKLKRNAEKFAALLRKEDLVIYENGMIVKKAKVYVWFEIDNIAELKSKKQVGPIVYGNEKAYKDFVSKWKNNSRTIKGPYVSESRVCFDLKPKYKTISQLVKASRKESGF